MTDYADTMSRKNTDTEPNESTDASADPQHWLATGRDIRAFALFCSVVRHGLANFSTRALPSKDSTVIQTAMDFTEYIAAGTNVREERDRVNRRGNNGG